MKHKDEEKLDEGYSSIPFIPDNEAHQFQYFPTVRDLLLAYNSKEDVIELESASQSGNNSLALKEVKSSNNNNNDKKQKEDRESSSEEEEEEEDEEKGGEDKSTTSSSNNKKESSDEE